MRNCLALNTWRPKLVAVLVASATWAAPTPAWAAGAAAGSDFVWASTFKDVNDTPQALAQYKGKTAVVYFWATWCIPCRLETPKLVQLFDAHKNQDLVVIGIALDNADKVRSFVQKYAVTYPVVYGGREAVQLTKDLGNDVGAIPFTVVIDKSGRIIETIKGDTPDGKLEQVVSALLN